MLKPGDGGAVSGGTEAPTEAQVGCHLQAVTLMKSFSRAGSPPLVPWLLDAAVSLGWPRIFFLKPMAAHSSEVSVGWP